MATDHPRIVAASSGGTVRGGAVSGLGGYAAARHLLDAALTRGRRGLAGRTWPTGRRTSGVGWRGRDLALIAAGLTFYAGIAVVPLLVLAFALTGLLTSTGDRARARRPAGRPAAGRAGRPGRRRRGWSRPGSGWTLLGGLLALLPMSLYGEGLRRALLRFSGRQEAMTAWRGRLAALPLLLVTPVLLYPLLLAAGVMADLADSGGAAAPSGGSRSASTRCSPP